LILLELLFTGMTERTLYKRNLTRVTGFERGKIRVEVLVSARFPVLPCYIQANLPHVKVAIVGILVHDTAQAGRGHRCS